MTGLGRGGFLGERYMPGPPPDPSAPPSRVSWRLGSGPTSWSEETEAMGEQSPPRSERGRRQALGLDSSERGQSRQSGTPHRPRGWLGGRPGGTALGPPPPLLGEGAGAPKRQGPSGEEAEEERKAGRAGPAQELGGATHLCSRPAEPEWPGSLAAPTRRSGRAPALPPSSALLQQLQRRRHRRAQPGNHGGRAARALTHLPPFSPPPPVLLPPPPERRWPRWEEKR